MLRRAHRYSQEQCDSIAAQCLVLSSPLPHHRRSLSRGWQWPRRACPHLDSTPWLSDESRLYRIGGPPQFDPPCDFSFLHIQFVYRRAVPQTDPGFRTGPVRHYGIGDTLQDCIRSCLYARSFTAATTRITPREAVIVKAIFCIVERARIPGEMTVPTRWCMQPLMLVLNEFDYYSSQPSNSPNWRKLR